MIQTNQQSVMVKLISFKNYLNKYSNEISNNKMDKKKAQFVLDCNSTSSRMPFYNGLRDNNLVYFFSSTNKKRQLYKLGLINKDGFVLEKSRIIGSARPIVGQKNKNASVSYSKKTQKLPPVSKDQFKAVIAKARQDHLKSNTVDDETNSNK